MTKENKRTRIVVHLMASLKPSGMERMFVSGSTEYINSGFKHVIIAQGTNNPYLRDIVDSGFDVYECRPIKSPSGVMSLFWTLRKIKPDIFHIHTEGAFAVSVTICRISSIRTKIVRTIHSVFRPHGRALLSRRIQSLLADSQVDAFVAPSPDVTINEADFGRNCHTILNWVDDKYLSTKRINQDDSLKSPLAIIVGNSSEIKNHIYALRPLLKSRVKLAFYGSEEGATMEEKLILDEMEVRGQLTHRGVGDPLEGLASADIFLIPSKHEGMGVALAEALAMGLPALVNDVPGLQWAQKCKGVTVVSDDEFSWEAAVKSLENYIPYESGIDMDFTSTRGVSEYSKIYESITSQ